MGFIQFCLDWGTQLDTLSLLGNAPVTQASVRGAQIQHDFNRNKYFDTKEALEYGVIDRIIKPPRTRVLGV